jgi:multidrug transporter EmrE-like cation transporter
MSVAQIASLSLFEIIGDASLKQYANDKGLVYFTMGIVGYIGVIITLIFSLQGSTLLLVNNAWDGANSLFESAFAFFILGERFDNYFQYFGIFFILIGLYLLKIPWEKKHPFHIPKE